MTFLDVMDGAIVNVALPTIRTHLGFSVQNLQWVVSGYLITYGGFLLLGGRAADLLGRRRLLIAGTTLFAASSLACALADNQGLLVGARLAQGLGAAMMSPAALSILTTTFAGSDRHKALGLWAGISGLATTVGLFFGGLLTEDLGWRWVFLVNLPMAALVLFGAFRMLKADHGRATAGGFDAVGAVLVTASMLLLIFTLVKAPNEGWGAARTIGGLAASAVLAAAFVVNEQRRAHPLVPLSIFRIKGLAAADATQVIAWAGFYSMFFFVTLYMQDVLHYSSLRSGLSYLPVSAGIAFGSTVATKMFIRTGTRPIIVSGALLAAGGILWLSRIPVNGTYLGNLLAPLVVMGVGLGLLYAGVQTAANAGVPRNRPAGRGPDHRVVPARVSAGPGGVQRDRDQSHQPSTGLPCPARGGTHRRIPTGPARQRPLPGGSRSHRAARRQHPRRTRRHTRNPTKPGALLRPRVTGHNEIPGWRSTPSRDSHYRRMRAMPILLPWSRRITGGQLSSAREGEQPLAQCQRAGLARQPVRSYRHEAVAAGVERLLAKTCLSEPGPDRGGQVGRTAVPGPQDERTGRAQAGQGCHRDLDVAVADVAEDAAYHHDLGGHRAGVDVGDPGVGLQHLDALQPSRLCRLQCKRDVALVQFDQPGAHVVPARMRGQHADYVPALPGAQADQADVPAGRTFELGAQVSLHTFPPL